MGGLVLMIDRTNEQGNYNLNSFSRMSHAFSPQGMLLIAAATLPEYERRNQHSGVDEDREVVARIHIQCCWPNNAFTVTPRRSL